MEHHRETTTSRSHSDNRGHSIDFAIPESVRQERLARRSRQTEIGTALSQRTIDERLKIIRNIGIDGQTPLYYAQDSIRVLAVAYEQDYQVAPNQDTKKLRDGTWKFLNTLDSLGNHLEQDRTNDATHEYINLKTQADNPIVDGIRTVWQDLHHMHDEERTLDNIAVR